MHVPYDTHMVHTRTIRVWSYHICHTIRVWYVPYVHGIKYACGTEHRHSTTYTKANRNIFKNVVSSQTFLICPYAVFCLPKKLTDAIQCYAIRPFERIVTVLCVNLSHQNICDCSEISSSIV